MIFLVEDDDATRDAICLLLECEALEVREFASCDLLVATADPRAAELLILDVQMKGTSGIEFLERLRSVDGAPACILMTGQPTPELRSRSARAGAFALLEKPFHGDELIATIRQALASSGA